MDNLLAKLYAEKPKRLSSNEITAHKESLKQISEDLERFLAGATGHPARLYGLWDRLA